MPLGLMGAQCPETAPSANRVGRIWPCRVKLMFQFNYLH